jgi:hypothetical protein
MKADEEVIYLAFSVPLPGHFHLEVLMMARNVGVPAAATVCSCF